MMDKLTSEQQLLLRALRRHLGTEASQALSFAPTADMLAAVCAMAGEQKILPMVYEGLLADDACAACLASEDGAPLRERLRQEVRRGVMLQTAKTYDFLQLYAYMEQCGIRPLVVKGIVCRALYPQPDHRPSSDEDLLVKPEQFWDAARQLMSLGAQTLKGEVIPAPEEAAPVPHEIGFVLGHGAGDGTFCVTGPGLYLELHTTLFDDDDGIGRAADALFANVHEAAVSCESGVRTLCPEQHLAYLILHACKHFVHAGFGIRQVMDIALFTAHYTDAEYIDPDALYRMLASLHLQRFAAGIFDIAQRALGISLPLTALWRTETAGADGTPMLIDILSGGIWGGTDGSRIHSAHLTLQAVRADGGERRGLLSAVFPPRRMLIGQYPYLARHPYLLPAAWGMRLWRYFLEMCGDRKHNNAAESLRIGRGRVQLLRYYRITGADTAPENRRDCTDVTKQ